MKDQAQPSDVKISARRKLIRGSFSLPAVLAVHNGSALAARSNQFRCVLNQTPAAGGVAPGLTETSQDWIRVNRYRQGSTNRYFVSIQDLQKVATDIGAPYLSYNGPAPTTNNEVTVNITGTGTVTANWVKWHSTNGSKPADNATLTADGSVAVLYKSTTSGSPPNVTVDKVEVVGFVKQGAGTNPGAYKGASTQSCWTSIKP